MIQDQLRFQTSINFVQIKVDERLIHFNVHIQLWIIAIKSINNIPDNSNVLANIHFCDNIYTRNGIECKILSSLEYSLFGTNV